MAIQILLNIKILVSKASGPVASTYIIMHPYATGSGEMPFGVT